MVTAEAAAVLPVLVLTAVLAVAVVGVAGARVRVGDAAHMAALAAARGDTEAARHLALQLAPGASVEIAVGAETTTVTVERQVRLGPLPGFAVRAETIAPVEPGTPPPPGGSGDSS